MRVRTIIKNALMPCVEIDDSRLSVEVVSQHTSSRMVKVRTWDNDFEKEVMNLDK